MKLIKRVWAQLRLAILQPQGVRYLCIIGGLIIASVGMLWCLTQWREMFMNSIQAVNYVKFIQSLGLFTVIVSLLILIRGYQSFFTRKLEFLSREILYDKYITKLGLEGTNSNVIEQRLTIDTIRAPQLAFAVGFGLVEAVITVPVFVITVAKLTAWYVLPAVLLYVCIGIYLANRIAKPLKQLDYDQQAKEAELYRKVIVWSKEFEGAPPSLHWVKENWKALALRAKLLGFFQSGHGQLGNIIPILVMSPQYFSGAITVGVLWASADACGRVVDSLTYLIDKRDVISELDACVTRLEEI
jgi:putative ATP-binding cassette transporter